MSFNHDTTAAKIINLRLCDWMRHNGKFQNTEKRWKEIKTRTAKKIASVTKTKTKTKKTTRKKIKMAWEKRRADNTQTRGKKSERTNTFTSKLIFKSSRVEPYQGVPLFYRILYFSTKKKHSTFEYMKCSWFFSFRRQMYARGVNRNIIFMCSLQIVGFCKQIITNKFHPVGELNDQISIFTLGLFSFPRLKYKGA